MQSPGAKGKICRKSAAFVSLYCGGAHLVSKYVIMIQPQGLSSYAPLEVCMVGRTYAPHQFDWIPDPGVRDIMQQIVGETEEDYVNLCSTLESLGVRVMRPSEPLGDYRERPPAQPRDDMAVVGTTLYVNRERPEYRQCLDEIQGWESVPRAPESHIVSTSFIHRHDHTLYWGTNQPEWRDSATVQRYRDRWSSEGWRVDIMANEGHGDCTWCIPRPGCIVTLHDISQDYYEQEFPGWDILYLEDKYWDLMSPFRRVKAQNGGKWWVPGQEDHIQFGEFVETYLREWVGFVEETVFEVNMLSISESCVLVNNHHPQVFEFLESHGVEPIITPFRHRWFWDGGVHCVTQDIRRG